MDKYIKQLLALYSKIILPDFGAIVISNEETGELMFNNYLTYDDGKLSGLIEKESSKDAQEAKNVVAKFVRDIKIQLDKGETYEIFQLGFFQKNDDGEYDFIGNFKSDTSTKASSKEQKEVDSSKKVEKSKESIEKKDDPPPIENVTPKKEKSPKSAQNKQIENEKKRAEKEKKKAEKKALKEKKKADKKAAKEKKIADKKAEKEKKEADKIKQIEAKQKILAEKKKEALSKKKEEKLTPIKKDEDKKKQAAPQPKETAKNKEEKPSKKSNTFVAANTQSPLKENDSSTKMDNPAKKEGKPKKEDIKKKEKSAQPKKEKEKRSPLFWVLLIIILLIIAGLLFLFLNYNKVSEYMGWNKFHKVEQNDKSAKQTKIPNKSVVVKAIPKDTVKDTVPKMEGTTVEKAATPTKEEPQNKAIASSSDLSDHHFHIIAGCFQEMSNANGLVKKLKENGHSDARIIGKLGALNEVAVGSYSTPQEAQKALNQLKSTFPGAWIDKR